MAGTFADRDAMARWISTHPYEMVGLLEQYETQQRLTQLEGLLHNFDTLRCLREMRQDAVNGGLAEDGTLVAAIDSAIGALED